MSPFLWACRNGAIPVLDWLVYNGISISEMMRAGISVCRCMDRTYIYIHTHTPKRYIWINFIVNLYALAYFIDDSTLSPFLWACCNGQIPVLDWLLSHGLPISVEMNRTGASAMHIRYRCSVCIYICINVTLFRLASIKS